MPHPRSLRSLVISPPSSSNVRKAHGPPSPTFSDATQASAMNFGAHEGPEKIITRANLKASLHAYDELLETSASYRAALMTMSQATAAFADAMGTCSGLKGPTYEAGTRLQAASGLHHLIGNQWHVLAETLEKKFEKPLRQHLDNYRAVVNERSAAYERQLYEKSHIIHQTEMQNMNRKGRNLQSFREALTVLQRQVDDLDELKAQHYQEIVEHEEEVWDVVQAKSCLVVRSTMDVFDRFTAKASDPVIEPMLQSVPDPFDSYGPPPAEDQIFSILPPLSIMASTPSPSPSPSTPEPETSRRRSWVPDESVYPSSPPTTAEWAREASSSSPTGSSTPPRSRSPPNRRNSHPPSTGTHMAESKLRSVLSVIDESRPRAHGREGSASTVTGRELSGNVNVNGVSSTGNEWGGAQSPYEANTPRTSRFMSEENHGSDPEVVPDGRGTPHSDETAHVPVAS